MHDLVSALAGTTRLANGRAVLQMNTPGPIVGILLAAGSASRFGGAKLLVPLANGTPVGVASLKNLTAAVDAVVAVIRPGDAALAEAFISQGARITACPHAAEGMGASLAWGVLAAPAAAGWVIALADMPWISPATVTCIAGALKRGSVLVAPVYLGARGHPVGVAGRFYSELKALSGDEGAKHLLAANAPALELIPVNDAAVLRDIDTPDDLQR
jgi:molybdenum cofactor cytidylyltransferase